MENMGIMPHNVEKQVKINNPPKPNANLVEGDEIIIVVISQVNLVANVKHWVIDSSVTRHICALFPTHQ